MPLPQLSDADMHSWLLALLGLVPPLLQWWRLTHLVLIWPAGNVTSAISRCLSPQSYPVLLDFSTSKLMDSKAATSSPRHNVLQGSSHTGRLDAKLSASRLLMHMTCGTNLTVLKVLSMLSTLSARRRPPLTRCRHQAGHLQTLQEIRTSSPP